MGINVEFLTSHFRCRLQVADLYRSLAAEGTRFTDPEADLVAVLRDVLPSPERGFELVFAWDLFDYLTKPQSRALATVLAAQCRPGATLFLMVTTGREIPQNPTAYCFRDVGALEYRGRTGRNREGPRLRPAEVAELTPGFRVDRSYLLRHGVQEYLLVRSD